jgi:predicted metallopeptidase
MRTKKGRVDWQNAPDIKTRVLHIIKSLGIDWIDISNIYCFRSYNSKSRAYARIWGLGKIWQMALNNKPAYIIEVLSERFDKLGKLEQDKVLLHELAHIPKNFSGSLLPHVRRGKRNFHDRVDRLVKLYIRTNKSKQ